MDVHVNRIPVSGRVTRVHVHARAVPAGVPARGREPATSAARSGSITAARRSSRARSSACWRAASSAASRTGAEVRAGDRFGIMKFGSRMDVFLPPTPRSRSGSATRSAAAKPSSRCYTDAGEPMTGRRARTAPRCACAPRRVRPSDRPRRASAPRRVPAAQPVHDGQHVLRLRLRRLRDARRVRDGGAVHRLRDRPRHARRPHRAADRHDQRVRRASSIRWPTSSRSAWRRRSCRSPGACSRSAASAGRPGSCSSTAAAMRLARFNIQSGRRPTSATSSACRARRPRRFRRRRSTRIP